MILPKDLKPCPFCGNDAEGLHDSYMRKDFQGISIRCKNCGADGPWADTIEGAKEEWNKRVISEQKQE